MRLAFLAFALAFSGAACARSGPEPLSNVRLGMSPRDVRAHFEPSSAGAWKTTLGSGGDTILEWTPREPSSAVGRVRFEFHLGMLVAVRARIRADGPERIEATPTSVLVRRPAAPGETDLTLLARDCPTHHDEAEALASKAR